MLTGCGLHGYPAGSWQFWIKPNCPPLISRQTRRNKKAPRLTEQGGALRRLRVPSTHLNVAATSVIRPLAVDVTVTALSLVPAMVLLLSATVWNCDPTD